MEYTDVKQDIIKGAVKPFYVFTGEERYVLNKYVHKLAEVARKALQQRESVSECMRGKTQSLFAQSGCFVVYDDKDFTGNEKAWDKVQEALGDNMLILVLSSVDKRSKFYKHFSEQIVTFNRVHPVTLKKYISDRMTLSNANAEYLIDVCESDCGRIFLELDKVKRVADRNGSDDYDRWFDELVDSGAIYTPPRDVIFAWADAVIARKPAEAFRLLEECLELGEPALRLLLVLFNNVKWLLQVQGCDSGNVSESTGLLYWQIQNVQKHCGVYSNRELVNALKTIQRAESGVKNGEISEDAVLPYVLINLFW